MPRPYDAVGATLGVSGERVRQRLAELLHTGLVRRIGAVPHHYKLGFTANGMSVWDVADAQVDALARQVAQLPGVSHCYLRPRSLPVWPCNLFAMLHGRSRDEVAEQAAQLAQLLGPHCRQHDILYSSAVLKKTGLRLKERLTMFRISQYMRELAKAEATGQYPVVRDRKATGPVVIWNLIRRCNLTCKHCYALSADHDYAGELGTRRGLHGDGRPARFRRARAHPLGGEPLMRPDLFDIAARAQGMGFYIGLSTNGTLIDEPMADRVAAAGFDYVGISLDGLKPTHDEFRRLDGAFDRSLAAVRFLGARGVKVGLRFTMTSMNAHDLPALLALMREEGAQKFYSRTSTTPGAATSTGARTRTSPPPARRWACCSNAPGKPHWTGWTKTT